MAPYLTAQQQQRGLEAYCVLGAMGVLHELTHLILMGQLCEAGTIAPIS